MHPRATLQMLVSAQIGTGVRRDHQLGAAYEERGRREFFGQRDTSDDPVRALAEFLDWFCTGEDGGFNDFLDPLKVIPEFTHEHGHALQDFKAVILETQELWQECSANTDSLEELLRRHMVSKE